LLPVTLTGLVIQVAAANRTQAGAFRPADRLPREIEANVLPKGLVQVQDVILTDLEAFHPLIRRNGFLPEEIAGGKEFLLQPENKLLLEFLQTAAAALPNNGPELSRGQNAAIGKEQSDFPFHGEIIWQILIYGIRTAFADMAFQLLRNIDPHGR